MSPQPAFALGQARLQARYAALPGEADWRRLAAARTYGAFIEDARVGPLRPWITGLSALSDAHEIDRGLRNLAADLVEEIVPWVPAPWRESVLWTRWLPFLAILEPLAREVPLPDWANRDYRLGHLMDARRLANPQAIAQAGLLDLMDGSQPGSIVALWVRTWRRRWPSLRGERRRHLESLADEVAAHLDEFRHATPQAAWGLRQALRERLRLRFHQRPLEPVLPFLYLALAFLDLERLRAELLRRRLFPDGLSVAESL